MNFHENSQPKIHSNFYLKDNRTSLLIFQWEQSYDVKLSHPLPLDLIYLDETISPNISFLMLLGFLLHVFLQLLGKPPSSHIWGTGVVGHIGRTIWSDNPTRTKLGRKHTARGPKQPQKRWICIPLQRSHCRSPQLHGCQELPLLLQPSQGFPPHLSPLRQGCCRSGQALQACQ